MRWWSVYIAIASSSYQWVRAQEAEVKKTPAHNVLALSFVAFGLALVFFKTASKSLTYAKRLARFYTQR